MDRHLFTTDVLRHAHDMRNDDICVLPECGERRDDPVHGHAVDCGYRRWLMDYPGRRIDRPDPCTCRSEGPKGRAMDRGRARVSDYDRTKPVNIPPLASNIVMVNRDDLRAVLAGISDNRSTGQCNFAWEKECADRLRWALDQRSERE